MKKEEMAPIIIGKLMNIGGVLQKEGDKMFQPFGLNQQQYSILFSISQTEKVNQKNVVNKLLLEKAHVSKVVKKLHSMGLIHIDSSIEDKRSAWLKTTDKGMQTVKDCQERISNWNRKWIEELSEEDMESILKSTALLQHLFSSSTTNTA